MTDVAAIAAGLTKVQRTYLTVRAFRPGNWSTGIEERLHTYPPSNTHQVLIRLGLVGSSGCILPLGLAVRAALDHAREKE